ncbi:MAG TPA: TldD/PmbA family protein [Solirubrobacterales bacterium]
MIELARRAVEGTLASGAGDAEAYASEDAGREVRVHGGEVESLTAATKRGIGIRAWIGCRVGYAYGTDLSAAGIAELASRAAEAARIADEDEFAGPPELPVRLFRDMTGKGAPEGEEALELSDPSLAATPTAEIAELTLEIERAALGADARIAGVEQAVYADSAERVAIVSSTGIEGEYERTDCYGYVQALAEGDGGRETGLGFDLARNPAALDPTAIGREAATRATAMIGAGKPASRGCPVVLDPTVAASFVGLIGRGLGADAVQRGRSPFAGLLGTAVAAKALVIHDDGLDPTGSASSPFDGEGVPRRRNALIEGGKLRTYLYDAYTARRDGAASTGSAGRAGYRSQPAVSASNLIVAPGASGFEELLREAGEGVLVTDVAGLHSGVNPVTGAFSVGASGRAIRAGEAAEPLREFTIAGDLVSMLRAVRAAGSRPRWVPFGGSVSTPPLLIGEMTVAGS